MIFDSLYDSLKHDFKRTFYLYTPVLATIGLWYASTTLASYTEQRALVLLMVNYVLSSITINLMLHNMAGKAFSIFQPMLLLLLLPLVAHHFFEVDAEVERLIPKVMTGLAWIIFIGRMYILSRQWCEFSQKHFWTIKKEPDSAEADKTK